MNAGVICLHLVTKHVPMPSKKDPSLSLKNGARNTNEKSASVSGISKEKINKKNTNGKANGQPGYATSEKDQFFDDEELLRVLTEVKNGNFNVRMPINQLGLSGKICDTLNDIISLN